MDLSRRTSNTIKNSVIGIIAQFIQVISSFACRMVFVRTLTEAYLGINGLFGNILSILSLGELGIGSAITFELYRSLANHNEEETKSLMSFYKKAYSYIGIVIGIIGIALFPFINRLVHTSSDIQENIYIMYSLYLLNTVVSYFFSYKASIIDAAQQNYVTTIIHTTVTIVQNITQIVVLLVFKNFLLYLCIQIACAIANNVIGAAVADKMFPFLKDISTAKPLPEKLKKKMYINVKDIFVSSVAGRLVNSTDNIIITALSGLAATGLNSNYSLLYATLITFTTKIQLGIKASIGNVNAVDSKEKRLSLFDEVHFVFFWMYFWCACCFILLVQDVIGVCFGKTYVMPFSVALITGLNFYVAEEGTIVEIFKETMGLFSKGKYTSIATGIINIILSIALGKKYGVQGILFATFASRMFTTRWYLPYVTFKYGFQSSSIRYFKAAARYWIEGIIIYLITWRICKLISLNGILALLAKAVICLIIPNLLIIVAHLKDKNFISTKERVLRITRERFRVS